MKLFSREHPAADPLADKTTRLQRVWYFWSELHLLWKALLVLLVLAILGIPFYRPAMRAQKAINHESDLATAKKALAEGNYVEARDYALQVLRGDPQKNDALPIFMRAAAGAADSRLMMAAREYLAQKTENKADRSFAWDVLSKQSPMGVAGMNWMMLRDDERKDPDFLAPWLERLVAESLLPLVDAELAKQTSQTDPRIEKIRLSQLARQATDVSHRELQARLLDRIASHPEDGPILLEVLDEIPQSALIPYAFTALGKWIEARGDKATVEDQMRLARCEIAANPDSKDAVLTRVTDTFGSSNPIQAARLHATMERFEKAKELLEPTLAKGDPDAFRLMATVLERLGKTEEWNKLLENPPEGVSMAQVWCDRAHIASKLGDGRSKTELEQKAFAAAELEAKSDSLIRLARHAYDRGLVDFSLDTWIKAIQRGSSSPLPFFYSIDPVIRSAAGGKKESQLFDMLRIYRSVEPGNLDVAIQYSYLGCLLGNVPPATVITELSAVRERLLQDPGNPATRALDCTIALAHLLEGHPEKAAELTGDTSIDWFNQIPAHRAIRAVALTKTGRKEEADVYLEGFDWDILLPGEMRVLRELLEIPVEIDEAQVALEAEKSEKARLAEEARQAQKARELEEIRKNLEAKAPTKSAEEEAAERAEKAERARLAEEARQAKRAAELKEIREKLAARAAKEAEEAKKSENAEPPATR